MDLMDRIRMRTGIGMALGQAGEGVQEFIFGFHGAN